MTNYIVSGLERSGTSLMMQIIEESGLKLAYNNNRPPDSDNPNGYYELHKGKIIGRLEEEEVDFDKYDGQFIKITSYGIKMLPKGDYKIIYMQRPVDEVYLSQNKKMGSSSMISEFDQKELLKKLDDFTIQFMEEREDIEYLTVNHRNLIENPEEELSKVTEFLGVDVIKGKDAIDKDLWRNRSPI